MSHLRRPLSRGEPPMARICVSQTRGCWVDLYEQSGFRGRRLRLSGPCSYVNLYVAPEDWGDEAGSLVAGPAAYVQCFEELNFPASIVWIVPGQRVADVAGLAIDDQLDSIQLFDRPPFASEPGYEAYLRLQQEEPPTLKLDVGRLRTS